MNCLRLLLLLLGYVFQERQELFKTVTPVIGVCISGGTRTV